MRWVVSLLILLAVVYYLWSRNRMPAAKQFKTTEEMMQYFADMTVKDAARENRITLDYSIESLKWVEHILGKLHEQYGRDGSKLHPNGLGMAYGAYIGQAIRRSDPDCRKGLACQWSRDHPVMGEKSYPLHWKDEDIFPCAWAYKRITDGPEDDIWIKYSVLKQMRFDQQKHLLTPQTKKQARAAGRR
jgi:hypothetical protein